MVMTLGQRPSWERKVILDVFCLEARRSLKPRTHSDGDLALPNSLSNLYFILLPDRRAPGATVATFDLISVYFSFSSRN